MRTNRRSGVKVEGQIDFVPLAILGDADVDAEDGGVGISEEGSEKRRFKAKGK